MSDMFSVHQAGVLAEYETARRKLDQTQGALLDARAECARLRAALRDLVDYVEDNRKYIPLRMGSKNTGAMTAARELLADPAGGGWGVSGSRWNRLGQQLEYVRNPLAYKIRKSIRPWTTHPEVPAKPKPTRCDCVSGDPRLCRFCVGGGA